MYSPWLQPAETLCRQDRFDTGYNWRSCKMFPVHMDDMMWNSAVKNRTLGNSFCRTQSLCCCYRSLEGKTGTQDCQLNCCNSPGCRVSTAALRPAAGRTLWNMEGRLQQTDTGLGQGSRCTVLCRCRSRILGHRPRRWMC